MSFREPGPPVRAGFSALEVVVAITIATILLTGLAAAVATVSRLERKAADRAEQQAARAHAGSVLGHELRPLDLRRDLHLSADTGALRAFRGIGIICAADSASADVRYRGLRAPDPAKDSLLVLRGAGVERALPLAGSGTAAPSCAAKPGEVAMAVRPGSGLVAGDVILIFERGTYHLASRALRYRRGASGRQPLTAEVFVDDSTDFAYRIAQAVSPETVGVRLRLTTTAPVQAAPGSSVRTYIPLLNLVQPLDSVPD